MRGNYGSSLPKMQRFIIQDPLDQSLPDELDALLNVMESAVGIAFRDFLSDSPLAWKKLQLIELAEAFNTEVKRPSRFGHNLQDIYILKYEEIRNLIYDFFYLLEGFRAFGLRYQPTKEHTRKLEREYKALSKRTSVLSSKLLNYEKAELGRIVRTKENCTMVLEMDRINSPFHEAFNHRRQPKQQFPALGSGALNTQGGQGLAPVQTLERVLQNYPTLLATYLDVEELLREIAGFESIVAEDQYFVEQVATSYYPSILSSLKTVPVRNAAQKEALTSEIMKQLKSVQLGLYQIIDKAVEQNMSKVKAQTEFLQNKVLGNPYLTLEKKVLSSTVEEKLAAAKEAQGIRETEQPSAFSLEPTPKPEPTPKLNKLTMNNNTFYAPKEEATDEYDFEDAYEDEEEDWDDAEYPASSALMPSKYYDSHKRLIEEYETRIMMMTNLLTELEYKKEWAGITQDEQKAIRSRAGHI